MTSMINLSCVFYVSTWGQKFCPKIEGTVEIRAREVPMGPWSVPMEWRCDGGMCDSPEQREYDFFWNSGGSQTSSIS